ncbi:MAG TPA: UbiA family prenyltransferase, partial [Candidatus Omnitrophota bacterium]|nr:UbiA family prenyltransferase [Candidatus Omnitrophota bacterium]
MWNKVRAFFELIKFEHTVFALPFAYLGTLLALGGRFEAGKFMWVTLAMVGARTAGMTLNRIVDLSIDRDNPRTKNRPLLTGALSMRAAWIAA